MICLDTNAVIALLNDGNSPVEARLNNALKASHPVAVSSVALFELWYGVAKSAWVDRNAARIADFMAGPLQVLSFDSDDAREAGDIRATLEQAGTPIGAYDILIAAQARRRAATLVTANMREFFRVPGLRVEDWSA